MAQTTTVTMVEFIEARLAEDEAAAQRTHVFVDPGPWHTPDARGLREVEAKRRIVAEKRITANGRKVILRALASVYDGHPDFREEWRP